MRKIFPLFLVVFSIMLWAVPNADVTKTEVDPYTLTSNSAPAEPVMEKPRIDVSIMRPVDSFVGTDNIWFDGSGYPPVILEDTTLLYCPDTSMFNHPVHLPDDAWSAATSDLYSTSAYKVWENYAISGEICDIHWWGFMLEYDAGWYECYETAAFDIIFYPDNGSGMPDTTNPACTYLGVVPTQDTTGFRYHATLQLPLWRFDVENLVPCCTLEAGWVSIQGVSPSTPDCWFLWQSSGTGDGSSWQWDGTGMVQTGYDRSLCLTGTGGPPIGRCCYNLDEDCVDTFEVACDMLGGYWDYGLNCIDDPCGCPEDKITIEVTTDAFPTEVSWELVNQSTGDTVASVPVGGYTLPNTLYSQDICVDSGGCYDFYVHDTYGDGGGPISIYLNFDLVWSHPGNYLYGTVAYNIGTGCGYLEGMCCYGDFYNPTCLDTSEAACTALGGDWTLGMNCIDDGCPSCNFVCPTVSVPEGEPICSTDYVDNFNGGCNSSPAVFSPYNVGDTVCGETGTYLYQGSNYRDTDWFEFVLTDAAHLQFTASVEVPFQLLLGTPGSPDPCVGYSFPILATAAECDTLSVDCGVLGPGTYWAWIGPSVFSGWPCGGQYWFVVDEAIGRCCYNNDLDCADVSEDSCTALAGEWTFGLNCTDNPCICPEDMIVVDITTDSWGYEVSWELVDEATGDTVFSIPTNFYGNNAHYIHEICVDSTDCFDFHIHDAYGDGGGPVELYLNDILVWSHPGNYGYGTSFEEIGNGCLYPEIEVTPSSITGEADPGFSDTDTITIANIGADTLFYVVGTQQDPTVTRFDGTVEPLYEVGDGSRKDLQPIGYLPISDKLKVETMPEGIREKGEPLYPPQTMAYGGPDAYGYTWIDSDEPGGPTYSWVDISTIGTEITAWTGSVDDGYTSLIPMGMSFNFYGSNYNSLMVSTNGWASFTQYTSSYLSNYPIPTSSDPNNLLAVEWDDLDGGTVGHCYYYYDSGENQFIVSWVGWPYYPDPTQPHDLQVILDGDDQTILYQYGTGIFQTDVTVGIENADGTDGLQVTYNAAYIHNDLAVLFSPPTIWLSTDITSGTIAPGGAPDIVQVIMDALELTAGIYTGRVVVESNDLDEPTVTVPVTFLVGGTGTVEGQVTDANTFTPIEGAIVTATLTTATSIVDTTDASGNYSITITPGTVNVTVEKEGYVTDSQDVTVVEDQTTTHNVALTAPIVSIDISPVIDTVAPGDTMVYTKTISNIGTAPLEYDVVFDFDVGPGIAVNPIIITERIANVIDPTGSADVAPFSFSGYNLPVITDYRDSLFVYMIEDATGDNGCLGVEFDGEFFWVTGRNASGGDIHKLHKFDRDGNLLVSYDQGTTTTWGWRDIAWDGEYLYASDENEFAIIDPTTGMKIGTLPKPTGLNPVRALAWDPATDHFWSANFSSDIYEFDRTGYIHNQYSNTKAVYGMAWDDLMEGGPWLWVNSQDGSPQMQISQFDPSSGTYTGETWQSALPTGHTAALAGGACFTTEWDPTVGVLVVLGQGTPTDFIYGYEIAENITWLRCQSGGSGSVDPDSSADIEFLVDFRDSTIVPDSTYQAVAIINTNDPYPEPEYNPQILFSITAGTGGCDYVVGDVNGSDTYNGLDITFGVAYFKGGPDPFCPFGTCPIPPCDAFFYCGDVNASCTFNGLDITYGVAYFKGGPGPNPCPSCPPTTGGPASLEGRQMEQIQIIKDKTVKQKEIDLK